MLEGHYLRAVHKAQKIASTSNVTKSMLNQLDNVCHQKTVDHIESRERNTMVFPMGICAVEWSSRIKFGSCSRKTTDIPVKAWNNNISIIKQPRVPCMFPIV